MSAPAGTMERIFPGDSQMARRMRALDWSRTDLGSPELWPQNLRIALGICLSSRFPMNVWWGRSLTLFYNDAYIAFLGPIKHPAVLGGSGKEAWAEIWDTIGPMIDRVFREGTASWSEDMLMYFNRDLPKEEVYVTFSFSPIFGETGAVEGMYCACTETTGKIVGNRRLDTLRRLGIEATLARSVSQAVEGILEVLRDNPDDLPFAALYLSEENHEVAALAGSCGIRGDGFGAPPKLPLGAMAPRGMLKVPISAAPEEPAGFLMGRPGSFRPVDASYRAFFDLVAGHIATAIANARAYEQERKRVEALAELDRAKTTFFSNVSHEFRTPLTLLLGPLEEELRTNPHASEGLKIAYRNSQRLLKLVNTLLDFARVEAGRLEASYEPVDLAGLTTELASVFRSAIERGGLKFTVECPPLSEPVYVDRGMWEKIVLNLLSNALKFTFEGTIDVSLRRKGDHVELAVGDTGTGIAESELPHVFERFYRVRGTRSRTYEGAGIGLALVRELVHLHGGEIAVRSTVGKGTTFTVSIPLGHAHLNNPVGPPARQAQPMSPGAGTFVEEARHWLPSPVAGADVAGAAIARGASSRDSAGSSRRARIVLADDNADMRAYVARLLGAHYEVVPTANGDEALAETQRQRTDLVLADVMMPKVDGFELVQRLRSDPRTAHIPIVLLSARAGEEERSEGLALGVDDYLVKPFSARELLARVRTHVDLARSRQDVEEALRSSNLEMEGRVREREALLKEIHHRVKNNLQVISSLLEMQARRLDDPRMAAQLEEAYHRVTSIASIHEMLYRGDDDTEIELAPYARELAGRLVSFHRVAARIPVVVKGDGIALELERSVSCGLLLNELVSNVCKHAYPGEGRGPLTISFRRDDEALTLEVADEGVGLPPDFDVSRSRSLGLQLVSTLAEQLGGKIVLGGRPGGARIEVTIPFRPRGKPSALSQGRQRN